MMKYKIEHAKGGYLKIVTEVEYNGKTLYIGSWSKDGDREKLLKDHEERVNNKEEFISKWYASNNTSREN